MYEPTTCQTPPKQYLSLSNKKMKITALLASLLLAVLTVAVAAIPEKSNTFTLAVVVGVCGGGVGVCND